VSHASYTYIKVLEGFFTCSHELLPLMQVARVGHPLKDVYSCWQEFGGIQWRSGCSNDVIVFGLNVLDLGSPSPCKEDAGSRLRKDMQQILPLLLCANCKEFLQQRCVSHVNLIMGRVVGKLTVNGAASVWTLHWNLHLMFHFSDTEPVLLVLNSLDVGFSTLYCPNALFPEEILNTGVTVIRYALIWTFIMLVVCNPALAPELSPLLHIIAMCHSSSRISPVQNSSLEITYGFGSFIPCQNFVTSFSLLAYHSSSISPLPSLYLHVEALIQNQPL
jgi:hypothetical protein